jgi:hypothetical protein
MMLTVHSNAFIFPVTYFFYPETAYRSLEEMDTIFRKTTSIWTLVRVAAEEPRRYGKNGELLINYTETEEHYTRVGENTEHEKHINKEHSNPQYHIENGDAGHASESS